MRIHLLVLFSASLAIANLNAADTVPLNVPDGFRITLFADDNLAHDIYSMTIDANGHVVVSGAGYVKRLKDTDGDGKADVAATFANGPKTGAQGMYFDGDDLLCTGDGGLIRYRDANSDGKADGPPEMIRKMNTGGEHHAHAIRKGPDGWFYVLCGNMTGIDESYVTLKTSPVKKPEAGTLLRFTPDFKNSEVVCHGYRNPYDFAFHSSGDIFVYDSDGERDVSLPWYRPTRVFMAMPGTHAGWVSRSWKRPDYFPDMPHVVGSFGRGSPTGVECYRHTQFPKKYRDAIFIADWTFGRVIALPLEMSGSVWKSDPVTFLTGKDGFGFAPTDMAVGPDGSLFVSVGGRGTRGGVYRVEWAGDAEHKSRDEGPVPSDGRKRKPAVSRDLRSAEGSADATLTKILSVPQPLSSWSRRRWEPLAERLNMRQAVYDRELSLPQRLRAIEISVENEHDEFVRDIRNYYVKNPTDIPRFQSALWLGRIGWALREQGNRVKKDDSETSFTKVSKHLLNRKHPYVLRQALESHFLLPRRVRPEWLGLELSDMLEHEDRFVRHTAIRAMSNWTEDEILRGSPKVDGLYGIFFSFTQRSQHDGLKDKDWEQMVWRLRNRTKDEQLSSWIRLIQVAMGEIGPSRNPAVFDGYSPRRPLRNDTRSLTATVSKVFPSTGVKTNWELARLLAMLSPEDPKLLTRVLAQIKPKSDPVHDIHYLIVAARIRGKRSEEHTKQIANGLASLETKIQDRKLNQDSNWDDRIGELYREHVKLDPNLPKALVSHFRFGEPGHVVFLKPLPDDVRPLAVNKFALTSLAQTTGGSSYEWNDEAVALLASSTQPVHKKMVRDLYSNPAVHSTVLKILARKPVEADRKKFVDGLRSADVGVVTASLEALEKLPADDAPATQFQLLHAVRRHFGDRKSDGLRKQALRLLTRNTGTSLNTPDEWSEKLTKRYPDAAKSALGEEFNNLRQLREKLAKVNWQEGDATRGKAVFLKQSCGKCHGGRRALGPDLKGVGKRFSRDDLFTAIAIPNRDVSSRYQTTQILTENGKTLTGLVVYESVDGLLLRSADITTHRIEANEIAIRKKLTTSLMPSGLLKDLKPRDYADLYAYIMQTN